MTSDPTNTSTSASTLCHPNRLCKSPLRFLTKSWRMALILLTADTTWPHFQCVLFCLCGLLATVVTVVAPNGTTVEGTSLWAKLMSPSKVLTFSDDPKDLPRNVLKMGVSENGGFSPQIIHFNRGFPLFSPSILGYPYFWKHPNLSSKYIRSCYRQALSLTKHCHFLLCFPQILPTHLSWWLFNNPFEQYVSQIGSWNPKFRGQIKKSLRLPAPSFQHTLKHTHKVGSFFPTNSGSLGFTIRFSRESSLNCVALFEGCFFLCSESYKRHQKTSKVTQQKTHILLSFKSWLVNRDPFNGLLQSHI